MVKIEAQSSKVTLAWLERSARGRELATRVEQLAIMISPT